jgi:hypothetical protein
VEALVLFVVAALAFSILGGVVEASWKRRSRRRLEEKAVVVLHPLARHRVRSVRYPLLARARYHLGLFFGFLVVAYIVVLLLTTIRSFIASWF